MEPFTSRSAVQFHSGLVVTESHPGQVVSPSPVPGMVRLLHIAQLASWLAVSEGRPKTEWGLEANSPAQSWLVGQHG